MERGYVCIYCGDGHGKSPAALGRAVLSAAQGKNVVIIRFLRGKGISDSYLKRLEPEVKIFRFEKSDRNYDRLSDEEKVEETINIRNGINFAKKVLTTGECDLLILDEILGLIDNQIITVPELKNLLDARDDETDIILTGVSSDAEICMLADEVSKFETLKTKCE